MSETFTQEFMDDLSVKTSEFTIVDYIMNSKKISFHDAILELAKYCELKPEFISKKSFRKSTRRDYFECLLESIKNEEKERNENKITAIQDGI